MSTQTVPYIDKATRDELQPPCELTYRGGRAATDPACPNTANVIFRTACPCCGKPTAYLVCTGHVAVCVDDADAPGVCRTCGQPSRAWAWTTEPLR